MKHLAILSALVLLSSGILADRLQKAVDDPPPEPVTCPLCGGNPQAHALRVFAIEHTIAEATVRVFRW